MKKILGVIAIIAILLMTGCSKNVEIENNNIQENQNNQGNLENQDNQDVQENQNNQQQEEVIKNSEKTVYNNEQLIEMAKKYREAKGLYIPKYIEVDNVDDDTVSIHLYDINIDGATATSDWYTINRNTGKGKNVLDEDIDLTFILNDYYWFTTDSYHSDMPGSFGAGMPDMYYFASDNTYSWIISDYTMNERVIAKKGTWKIENNKLVLHEQEETYLDGGKLIEIKDDPMLGNANILVDYTVTNKKVDNITEHSLEYVGLSDYSKTVDGKYVKTEGDIRYEYLMDGKAMYSNIPKSQGRSVENWLEVSRSKNK